MSRLLRALPALLVLPLAVSGCTRNLPAAKGDATRVSADGKPPEYPSDFTPPPPLSNPAAGDPNAFGLAYLESLYPELRDGWTAFLEDCRLRLPPSHPLNEAALSATLELTIGRQGELLGLTVATSSGNSEYDTVARQVVSESAPFPVPPPELVSDDDRVHISWIFARDARQAGVATAAVRRVEWPVERAVPKLMQAGDLSLAARRIAAALSSGPPPQAEADKFLGLGETLLVAVVREALQSADPEVQRVAIGAAAAGKVRAVAGELRAIADGTVDSALRGDAVAALAVIGDTEATPLLLAILQNETGANAKVNAEIARALGQLGKGAEAAEVIRGWLGSDVKEKRWAGLIALSRFAAPGAVKTLGGLLGAGERDVRVAACTALGTAASVDGAEAVKQLQRGLADKDAAVRAACAQGMASAAEAGARSRVAFWKVAELFKDRDDRVRAGAVLAAGRLEPTRFLKEAEVLGREKSPAVLSALADALSGIPGGPAVSRLKSLAGHADPGVRVGAVTALAARSEPDARRVAAATLSDSDPRVRLAAVAAVDDATVLDGVLSDPQPELRVAALARIVTLRGRLATLGEIARRIAEAPPASAERARLAQSWLAAR